jgi:hypothetical protein
VGFLNRKLSIAAAFALLLSAAFASPAAAVERFASASGVNTGNCQNTVGNPPCNITRAVNLAAASDVVTAMNDGDLVATTQLNFPADITLRGAPGGPPPRIVSDQASAISLGDTGSEMRDIRLEHTNTTGTALIAQTGTTVQRVFVRSVGVNACSLRDNALIRDSVCWNVFATLHHGLAVSSIDATPSNVTARNVTAISTGTGNGVRSTAFGSGDSALDARNVIAQSAGSFDVQAVGSTDPLGQASVTLGNSNYDSAGTTSNAGGATVTPTGAATIQGAPPIFVDAANGDFHQMQGSPTVNAGSAAVSFLGTLDFEGEARNQDGAPDIGADELVPTPPETTITSGPSGTIAETDASFDFSSSQAGTFQCALDGGEFGPCSGPGASHSFSGLAEGAHLFRVRALNQNLIPDPSPATREFTVALPHADTDPPTAEITKGPPNRTEREKAKFKFISDEPGSTFECKLDRKPYKACASPRRYRNLDEKKHKFFVRATDPAGNTGAADKDKWKVLD